MRLKDWPEPETHEQFWNVIFQDRRNGKTYRTKVCAADNESEESVRKHCALWKPQCEIISLTKGERLEI